MLFSLLFFQKCLCIFAPLESQVHKKIFKTIPYPRATTLPRFGGATANLPCRIDGGTLKNAFFFPLFFRKWFSIFAPLEDQAHEKLFKMIPYPRAFTLPSFGGATANLPLRIDGGTSQDALFPILLALLAYLADPRCLQAQKNCRTHPLWRKRLWPWHETHHHKSRQVAL